MIMKRIKCPKCGKYLLQGFSYAVVSVGCSCGGYVELKNGKVLTDIDGVDKHKNPRKKGRYGND